ncbi:DUF5658 family protein [Natrononativus amylolyticus]|uniref:DUF5658 family protein n=1 Tax=Natrononativus amylolyticus TaxID=2963434 RepID=UPI0020CE08C6|nr:DUF5658 family protein [Natrononativus amylolyticus]
MSSDGAHWRHQLRGTEYEMDDLERVLWVVVALSLVGDIVTTFVGLNLGLSESNPIALYAIEGWGLLGMLALKAFAVGVGLCCRPLLPKAYAPIIPAGLALPWVIAVFINLYMISTVV